MKAKLFDKTLIKVNLIIYNGTLENPSTTTTTKTLCACYKYSCILKKHKFTESQNPICTFITHIVGGYTQVSTYIYTPATYTQQHNIMIQQIPSQRCGAVIRAHDRSVLYYTSI